MMSENQPDGALAGTKVLDLTHQLAGPFCTMVLADLGADVAKIERPGSGDYSRTGAGSGKRVDGVRGYFASINRNKRSLALDLKNPAGHALAVRLADQADVLVENFSPGTLASMGLGYESLAARNPGLVYASCSGFGQSARTGQYRGVDPVIQAISGAMSITGEPEGPPVRVGFSFGDIGAGMWLAMAVLAALVERSRSGQGQHLDIAMMDCAVAVLENAITRYLWDGEIPGRLGSRHPLVPGMGAFETRDGYLVLSGVSDVIWPELCAGLAREDLLADPRFGTSQARYAHRAELEAVLETHLRTQTTRFWLDRLRPLGTFATPINTIPEMLGEPSVKDRGQIQQVRQQHGTPMPLVGSPLRMSRTPARIRFAAPLLGQHQQQILRDWLDLSDEEILAHAQAGAFAGSR